ncbi:DUF397 domain-containing protein [Streptomyces sp. AM6-12]|uniref:DUF397 domain-containing protein n=1 Tax=Streptomyces sp. AM6-12 TaxID=3345149 RepID=UPI0037B0B8D2
MQNENNETLAWVKSSYSVQNACVEVAVTANGGRAVRDSKNPSGPIHRYTPAEWTAFVQGVKAGEFDI